MKALLSSFDPFTSAYHKIPTSQISFHLFQNFLVSKGHEIVEGYVRLHDYQFENKITSENEGVFSHTCFINYRSSLISSVY